MASSDPETSSESEYQVFLSFRGPDTRKGFTNVLFHYLTDAGICVFLDDKELPVGTRISGSLEQAIDKSRIYIPIFSQNYASSQWCLRELTQFLKKVSESGGNKKILPIFFNVIPDDVKLKTPLYSNAIKSLQQKKKLNNKQVDAWRKALKEVGAMKGWEVEKYEGHGTLIKLVVEEVLQTLKTKDRLVTNHLVGINDGVTAIGKLLAINSSGVRLIQIHGMGGIGKTTLAKVVFNQVSSYFGRLCCFVEDVRVKLLSTNGLFELHKKLLFEISVPTGIRSTDDNDYGMQRTREALRNKKVLIVLDDVDNSKQVENLVGELALDPGSRILITTRNKVNLQMNTSKFEILDYEMKVMSFDHALELFSWHAFNKDSPLDAYNDLSREIVSYIEGLPLALEVIGSLLCDKEEKLWKETMEKLKKAPHKDVFERLRISYDVLTFEQKQIFLDIACFFYGKNMTNAMYMWKDCNFFPSYEVDALERMSLIKIVDDKFQMHGQLRDLGRKIVHQENPMNPGERSRIWIDKEGLDAIRTKELKKNVQALDLDLLKIDNENAITSEEIERLEHLRYLQLEGATMVGNFANRLSELKWLLWSHASQISKATNIHFKNVVILQFLSNRSINDLKLHGLVKMAGKLKVLYLKNCENITGTPNFFGCSNLERLTFKKCCNFRKIDSSIGKLKRLTHLKIDTCNNLKDLPEEIGDLVSLKHFFLQCREVKKFPNSIWRLKSLREVHLLSHANSANSWELPSSIEMLQNLEVLQVNQCNLKGQLPPGIKSLSLLRVLDLSKTGVYVVPKTISKLTLLERLELRECDEIQELPALPTSLTHLIVSSKSLQVVPNLSNLTNLVELELNDWKGGRDKLCKGKLLWIGRLSKLTKLSIGLRNVSASIELASLPLLNELDLFGLDLQSYPQLPLSLQKLGLHYFNSIASLSPNMSNLSHLKLSRCPMQEFQLDRLQFPHLKVLVVERCPPLKRVSLSSMLKLEHVEVIGCPVLVDIQFSHVFESLEALVIERCKSLGRLVYEVEAGPDNDESANEVISCRGTLILRSRVFNKLKHFGLFGCPKIRMIQVVGTSKSWEGFTIVDCTSLRCLRDLSNLENLKYIHLYDNPELRIVKGLDELGFLVNLQVRNCKLLETLIDVSSTKLPNDCHMQISGCRALLGFGKIFHGSIQGFKDYMVRCESTSNARFGFCSRYTGHFKQKRESNFEPEEESDVDQEHQSDLRTRTGTRTGKRFQTGRG